jgi:Zn-dependent metalloprotease
MFTFTKRFMRKSALLFSLGSCLAGFNAMAQQNTVDNTIQSIERNKFDHTTKSATFSPSAGWKKGEANEIFKKYLGLDGVTNKMVLKNSTTTKNGITIERYTQYYKSIKVEHGDYTLTTKGGIVRFINGNVYKADNSLSTAPGLTETAAFAKAKQFVGADKYMWEDPAAEAQIKKRYHKTDTSYLPQARLVWIEDLQMGKDDRKLHLAYAFDIYAQKPISRQVVYVDANTGHILFSNSIMQNIAAPTTVRTRYSGSVGIVTQYDGVSTYLLFDSTRGGGVYTQNLNNATTAGFSFVTDYTNTVNIWPVLPYDTIASDAHWGAEMVYDYWLSQHGRSSWDGAGGILQQYVHVDTGLNNAYWDGSAMNYGDGTGVAAGGFDPLVSLDVTGHEIGHGVCQATAALVYARESGAMNEGFSDCWAANIEHYADPHETDAVAKQYWKIGEEIGGGTPLRNMDNPALEGDPSSIRDGNWTPATTADGCATPSGGNDQCGVHTNSGVLNHWYYLVVMGGSGTNTLGTTYAVSGIGWVSGSDILYQTELTLASTDNYAACRTVSIAAATTLYGGCSAETQAVTDAWHAVGVGAAFVPCTPQIGFVATSINVTEKSNATSCPASHTINIGLKAIGTPISGGSPTVNVVAAYGTAVASVDYSFGTTSLTFSPGDTTTHNATITIIDNGVVHDSKYLKLGFTLTTGGSTATISPLYDSLLINIDNDDSVPSAGGSEYHTLDTAISGGYATCNLTSAFAGTNKRGHSQYLISAADLSAAGVRAGVPINQLGMYIVTRNSTTAFVGYTVAMANTTSTDLSTAYASGTFTTVYSGNFTTYAGWDTINFSTPFTWNGTDNVAVNVCWGSNSASFSANDQMAGVNMSSTLITNRTGTSGGAGTGCSLGWSGGGTGTARPFMRFRQNKPPASIETTASSTRVWNVKTGTEVYFYTPTADTNVITGLNNETADLGCVTSTVTQAGVGFTAAVFSGANRSRKEISITPTTGAGATYDVMFYMTNTELNAVAPGTLYLLKTTAATDAAINGSNTTLVTPTLITAPTYVGFKGTFTGFGRYFLTDGPLCTPPTTTVTASGPTAICTGGSVTLTAASGTGYSYQWRIGGTNIAGATSASYSATAAGSYDVVVTLGTCNATSAATTISIIALYAAPIGGATGVCTGSIATVTDATTGGSWSSSNPTLASINSSGVITGVATGTVTITYSVTNACGTAAVTTSIAVSNPTSVAAITGGTPICPGSTTTLSDATASGVWTTATASIASVSTSGIVTGVGAGSVTISYSVTNAAGCVSSATTTINVNSGPTATITPAGPTTICSGSTVVLNATTGSGYAYQWKVGGTIIAGATTASYTASTTGNYAVVITNGSGCSSTSAGVTVTVTAALTIVPGVTINAAPGTTLCTGMTSASFSATVVNGGIPTYQWYKNGSAVSTAPTYAYSPSSGDIVKVVIHSTAACAFPDTAADMVTMSFSPYVNPSVSIVAAPNDTVCQGTVTIFTAIPVNGGATPTYSWKKNGIGVATGPTYNYIPANNDVLVCTLTSDFLCRTQDTAVSSPLTVTVDSSVVNTVTITANHSSIILGQSVTFVASATHGGSSPAYQWYINGFAVPGATNATYTTTSLTYGQVVTCRVMSSEACAVPNNAVSGGITVIVSSGVAQLSDGSSFNLMPNPNNGSFVISGTLGNLNDEAIGIKVTDMLGQVVYTTTAKVSNSTINERITLSTSLASGMYLVNITSSDGSVVFHVVIDK